MYTITECKNHKGENTNQHRIGRKVKKVDYHDGRAYIYNANDTVTITSNLWKKFEGKQELQLITENSTYILKKTK